MSGRGRGRAGHRLRASHTRDLALFSEFGPTGRRDTPGEEAARAGGRTASRRSGWRCVGDVWGDLEGPSPCSPRPAFKAADGTVPSLDVSTSKPSGFPKLRLSGQLPSRDGLKPNLRCRPASLSG
ncbi:hypothetical protein mRhiFer1_009208 [Rhinolophus ferrumequinum]|uniref:Uncharacterized protein n=1 Tax=Rhinolophus ferrumequinum TaxID=59479 RepID=A0A7J7SJM3_RHIFE|nr:hypothetical protein mRhiFer1_009208 [Rhinolophus ferrumequinum]